MASITVTKNPSKQRKRTANAPLHIKRKQIRAHLSAELRNDLLKQPWYREVSDRPIRALTIRKGDEVVLVKGMKTAKGDCFRGKVSSVNTKKGTIVVENVVTTKSDGTKVAKPLHPSNVILVRLDLSDDYRKEQIRHIAKGGRNE